jgi:diaminopimelate epimerase
MKMTSQWTISIGKPIMAPCLIPVEHKSTPHCINDPFMINGDCFKVTAMSFGSPHGAVFVDDCDSVDVEAIGHSLGTHRLFPKGASIVFIQMLDRENLKARLWQWGEGETPFTPEAVCVAGVAAMKLQKVLTSVANVYMGDNIFQVEWNRGIGDVWMTGLADGL